MYSELEKRLIANLVDVLAQNLEESSTTDGLFFSGFIRCHKEAMILLTKLGIMETPWPEEMETPGRSYSAKFVPQWELKVFHDG